MSPPFEVEDLEAVRSVLARAVSLGMAGGDADEHVAHAARFARSLAAIPTQRCLDLGTGAGIPGLVLASAGIGDEWLLVDGSTKRGEFVREAVTLLDLDGRVRVEVGRAEELARRPDLRAAWDVVTARSFGSPATTAECAAGFLRPGGALLVSEPPGSDGTRWSGLATVPELGMDLVGGPVDGIQTVKQTRGCAERVPRRVGVPAKRPLFS